VTTKRKHISTKARTAFFLQRKGICYLCGGAVRPGELWDIEHVIALELGGADDETNWEVAHKKCHAPKTKDDVGKIAKAKRREARHLGAKVSRTPMPFGRKSKFKRKMDGTVVLRENDE
jgi:5-methylcytosine-specific restriction endonuclease McrA